MGAIWAEPDLPADPVRAKFQAEGVREPGDDGVETAAEFEEMQFLAEHVVTRLLNRRAFNDRLSRKVPVGAIDTDGARALPPDGFKALNDRNGHAAGDQALEVVAGVPTSVPAPPDAAFRIGDD